MPVQPHSPQPGLAEGEIWFLANDLGLGHGDTANTTREGQGTCAAAASAGCRREDTEGSQFCSAFASTMSCNSARPQGTEILMSKWLPPSITATTQTQFYLTAVPPPLIQKYKTAIWDLQEGENTALVEAWC